MAFEQLMAEATAKREKKADTKKEKEKEKGERHSMFGHKHEEKPSVSTS
jgi:hypothetical protein